VKAKRSVYPFSKRERERERERNGKQLERFLLAVVLVAFWK